MEAEPRELWATCPSDPVDDLSFFLDQRIKRLNKNRASSRSKTTKNADSVESSNVEEKFFTFKRKPIQPQIEEDESTEESQNKKRKAVSDSPANVAAVASPVPSSTAATAADTLSAAAISVAASGSNGDEDATFIRRRYNHSLINGITDSMIFPRRSLQLPPRPKDSKEKKAASPGKVLEGGEGKPVATTSTATTGDGEEDATDNQVEEGEEVEKASTEPPGSADIFRPHRQYYHSRSRLLMQPGGWAIDSDDESDHEWLDELGQAVRFFFICSF